MSRTQINTTLISNSGPSAIVPSGTVLDYAGPTAPTGWTECDGSAISRTTFATLFTAIGTTWGPGDGSTTFNVPDLRRRACVGRGGAGTGTLGSTLGSTGGEENHVLTVGELAAHNHTITDPGHSHTTTWQLSSQGGGAHAINPSTNNGESGSVAAGTNSVGTNISVNSNGSNTGHNTIQPSAVMIKIIKN